MSFIFFSQQYKLESYVHLGDHHQLPGCGLNFDLFIFGASFIYFVATQRLASLRLHALPSGREGKAYSMLITAFARYNTQKWKTHTVLYFSQWDVICGL